MSGSILLHPTDGLNARLTTCQQCGKDGEDLILVGANDSIYECSGCDMRHYGKPRGGRCTKCNAFVEFIRKLLPEERLPSSEPCGACRELNEQVAEIVKAGGIFFKCNDCGSTGAIRADHDLSVKVRQQTGIQAPDPVGVEFTKAEGCPSCGQGEEDDA